MVLNIIQNEISRFQIWDKFGPNLEYVNGQVMEFNFIQKVIIFYIYPETFIKIFQVVLNIIKNEHSIFQNWPKFGQNVEYVIDQDMEFHFIQKVIPFSIHTESFIKIFQLVLNIIQNDCAEYCRNHIIYLEFVQKGLQCLGHF